MIQVDNQVRKQVINNIRTYVDIQTVNHVMNHIKNHIRNQVENQLWNHVTYPVSEQLRIEQYDTSKKSNT